MSRVRTSLRAPQGATSRWAQHGRRIHLAVIVLASIGVLTIFGFFRLLGLNMPA